MRLWIIMLKPPHMRGNMLKPTPKSEAIKIIKKMKQAEKATVNCIVV